MAGEEALGVEKVAGGGRHARCRTLIGGGLVRELEL
jgi:hypothetical protein